MTKSSGKPSRLSGGRIAVEVGALCAIVACTVFTLDPHVLLKEAENSLGQQIAAGSTAVALTGLCFRGKAAARRVQEWFVRRGETEDDLESHRTVVATVAGAATVVGSETVASVETVASAETMKAVGPSGTGEVLGVDDSLSVRLRREPVSYPSFPAEYYGWLSNATKAFIVAVYVFQLIDPKRRTVFLQSLADVAGRRDGDVWIAALCPDSDAALKRADELKETHPDFLAVMEKNLWTLHKWRERLPEQARARIKIVLYPEYADGPSPFQAQPQYVCDDTALLGLLPLGYPSQDASHLRVPLDHPLMAVNNEYRDLIRGRAVPLDKHIMARVTVDLPGGPTLYNVKYVQDDEPKATIYLAVHGRTDHDRLERSKTVGLLLHGAGIPVVCRLTVLDPDRDRVLITLNDMRMKEKFGVKAGLYFYYRVEETDLTGGFRAPDARALPETETAIETETETMGGDGCL